MGILGPWHFCNIDTLKNGKFFIVHLIKYQWTQNGDFETIDLLSVFPCNFSKIVFLSGHSYVSLSRLEKSYCICIILYDNMNWDILVVECKMSLRSVVTKIYEKSLFSTEVFFFYGNMCKCHQIFTSLSQLLDITCPLQGNFFVSFLLKNYAHSIFGK